MAPFGQVVLGVQEQVAEAKTKRLEGPDVERSHNRKTKSATAGFID